jgi:hypothetical protein
VREVRKRPAFLLMIRIGEIFEAELSSSKFPQTASVE